MTTLSVLSRVKPKLHYWLEISKFFQGTRQILKFWCVESVPAKLWERIQLQIAAVSVQLNIIRWKVVHPKPELNNQSKHSILEFQNISTEEDYSKYKSWVHKIKPGISRLILKPQSGQLPPPPHRNGPETSPIHCLLQNRKDSFQEVSRGNIHKRQAFQSS